MTPDQLARKAPRTHQVLMFLIAERSAGRRMPTYRQIREHMGWKGDGGPTDALMSLFHHGFLTREDAETSAKQRCRYAYDLKPEYLQKTPETTP